jgi:hypothetical protein
MMKKASSRRGRWRDGSILGLCWIDDAHCPPLSLLSLSSFGVLFAFVATDSIVAVWHHRCNFRHRHRHCRRRHHRRCCHRCHCLFVPITIALATVVITLAAIAAWFLLSSLPFGVIVAGVTIAAVVALAVVTATVLAIATTLVPS